MGVFAMAIPSPAGLGCLNSDSFTRFCPFGFQRKLNSRKNETIGNKQMYGLAGN